MLYTVLGRYFLFSIMGVETLVLPYFLPKELYGEVEFLKFSAFLAQYTLIGAGTGYIVSYLQQNKRQEHASSFLILGAFLNSIIVGFVLFFFVNWHMIVLSTIAIIAIAIESIIKVKEKYLLALAFKPILSLSLIFLLPIILKSYVDVGAYVMLSYFVAIIIYSSLAFRFLNDTAYSFRIISLSDFIIAVKFYFKFIQAGFLMNISTAMVFIFFYLDRLTIRNNFSEYLGDYSFSFSIMQLTIVAITTFSYVNIVEFGKKNIETGKLQKEVFRSLKNCFIFYLGLGLVSILFSYGAEKFYKYENVFETTCLMVGLYGFASVLSSINSVYLYLKRIKVLAIMIFIALLLSLLMNLVIPLSGVSGYFILLVKTYGIFLLFSICSFLYVVVRLHAESKIHSR